MKSLAKRRDAGTRLASGNRNGTETRPRMPRMLGEVHPRSSPKKPREPVDSMDSRRNASRVIRPRRGRRCTVPCRNRGQCGEPIDSDRLERKNRSDPATIIGAAETVATGVTVSVPRRFSFRPRSALCMRHGERRNGNPCSGVGYIARRPSKRPRGSCHAGRSLKGGRAKAFTAPCFTGQQCETVTQLSKNHYADIGR